jgi:hypothetical protein
MLVPWFFNFGGRTTTVLVLDKHFSGRQIETEEVLSKCFCKSLPEQCKQKQSRNHANQSDGHPKLPTIRSESTRKQTKTEPRRHRFFAEVSPSRARSHVNLCVLEKPIPPLALGRGRWAPPPPPVRPSTHQPSDPHPESIPAVRRLCQPPRGNPPSFFPLTFSKPPPRLLLPTFSSPVLQIATEPSSPPPLLPKRSGVSNPAPRRDPVGPSVPRSGQCCVDRAAAAADHGEPAHWDGIRSIDAFAGCFSRLVSVRFGCSCVNLDPVWSDASASAWLIVLFFLLPIVMCLVELRGG